MRAICSFARCTGRTAGRIAAVACAAASGASAAQARITLPAGPYIALDGPNTAIRASDTQGCTSDCTFSLTADHLDGSPSTPLASLPIDGTECPGGDPNFNRDSVRDVAAAGEGRVLVLAVNSQCGYPYTGQWYAGPYAGPLEPVPFPACDGGDGTAEAVSSNYEARACITAGGIEVAAVPATGTAAARTFDFPAGARVRLALAGDDLAIDSENAGTAHVTVTDLSTGAQLYAFSAPAPLSLALQDDGTTVAGSETIGGFCPGLTGLAWRSPSAPSGTPLAYSACGQLTLTGGTVIFQHGLTGNFTRVERGNLAGALPRLLTTFSEHGELEAADADHVVAVDEDCAQRVTTYAAPGGGRDMPGLPRCPIAFAAHTAKATLDVVDRELVVVVPLRCPRGCTPVRFRIAGTKATLTDGGTTHGHISTWPISTFNRRLVRACIRYRSELAAFRRRQLVHRPDPPIATVKVTGIDRTGTPTTYSARLRLNLRFTRG